MVPQARSDLIVSAAGNEVVVYDSSLHRVHHLNRTAALVWKLCDGKTLVPHMTAALERELGTPVTDELVQTALGELQEARLLQEPPEAPAPAGRLTRREFNRRARLTGALAVIAPVVITLVAPTAAQASSCPGGRGDGALNAAEIAGIAVPVTAGAVQGVRHERRRGRRRSKAAGAPEAISLFPGGTGNPADGGGAGGSLFGGPGAGTAQ